MKKLLFLFCAVLAITFASCGNGGKDAQVIYEKIQAGETLSQDDYKVMIDYIEKPLLKAVDEIKDAKEVTDLEKKFSELSEKFPYVQPFTQYLTSHAYDLDEDNMEEFGKVLKKLQESAQ